MIRAASATSLLIPAVLAIAVACASCSEGALTEEPGELTASTEGRDPRETASGAAEASAPEAGRFGAGFVVWESNRSGNWRIWTRRLDGSELRQLSPNERGRQHCCAHISPDGELLTYLSLATKKNVFPGPGEFGELHVIAPEGGEDRVVAVDAHTYFENRAAVWRSPSELIYIGEERQTFILDLDSGERAVLLRSPAEGYGRLVDPTLEYATHGYVSFDVYLEKAREVAPRRGLGGCQPYFSHDGRWGFWTAGGGGPFKRIDLATSVVTTVLKKGDERLPGDRGYIYFPMYSRDGRMLAFSASTGEHSHFTADYEVFVVESDPATLEILETPVRLTFDPGTDRFPDVYQVPLPLGRHSGEVPLTVRLAAAAPTGAWQWNFGDGTQATGSDGIHTYRQPGAFRVTASLGETELEGRVIALAARPPQVVTTELRQERSLLVRFDEAIALGRPQVRFESGRAISGVVAEDDGNSLRIELEEPLDASDRLQLAGVRDRAERPNVMEPVTLEIEPPLWPSRRKDLVFLWQSGDAPNLIDDRDLGAPRACSVEAHGLARLNRDFAMQIDRGYFSTSVEAGAYIVRQCQAANEISLEMVLTPRSELGGEPAIIFMSGDERGLNIALAQQRDRLLLQVRIGPRSQSYPWIELMPLTIGVPHHVVVAFAAHEVKAYLDGRLLLHETEEVKGDLFHFRQRGLFFGSAPGGRRPWSGTLEGVAIYSRVLDLDEVAENARRQAAERRRRPTVDQLVIDARLVTSSPRPTLEEITPYREALMVHRYEIEDVVAGSVTGDALLVAQWAILDGQHRPAADHSPGRRARLVLEPFAENPQLESVYLADTLSEGADLQLYYAVEP